MRGLLALLVLGLTLLPSASAQAEPDGTGITIAVVDSGVDASHAELAGRVTRVSFWDPGLPIDLPVDVPLSDPDGQGTAVASVAAGSTLGVAPRARILDLQVSAQYTSGAVDPATEQAAIQALDYLLQDSGRAQVVILSFAQDGLSDSGAATLVQQVEGLWDAGVLVVVPAGPQSNVLSAAPFAFTVAGSEQCPAPIASAHLKPDVVAKSQSVPVAVPGNDVQPGGTGSASGTAYAAGQAAGALALLLSSNTSLPHDAAAAFLRDAADDLGEDGPDRCSGFGAANAEAALMWAAQWSDPLTAQHTKDAPGLAALALLAPVAAAAILRRRA